MVGAADTPSGPLSLSLRSVSGAPHPSSLALLGALTASLRSLPSNAPSGGVLGCLAPVPILRVAPPRTPAGIHPCRGGIKSAFYGRVRGRTSPTGLLTQA